MTAGQVAVVVLITAIGALLQGSVGIGMALVAGPVLVTIEPGFIPAPLMLATQVISIRHSVAERDKTDRRAIGHCLLGLPFGVAAALAVVAVVDDGAMALFIGAATSVACIALLVGLRPRRTARSEVTGGAMIALSAVAAGLPGPPGVVTFNDLDGPALRGTLSTYMIFVSTIGVVGLIVTGSLGPGDLLLVGYLLPGIGLGLLAARFLRHHLDRAWFRPVVLTVALCGGLALVVRELT